MAEELATRRYEPGDADRVWTVHERALRASPLPFVEDAPADEDLTAIGDRYLDAGGEFLVGLANGTIVAVGGFRPRGDAAELRRLRVHPDYQRRGYGERLLAALEDRARDRGFDRIVLETHGSLTAARALYEARGYEEVRRTPHPETDGELVSYRRSIGECTRTR